jgi:hypothetical protein
MTDTDSEFIHSNPHRLGRDIQAGFMYLGEQTNKINVGSNISVGSSGRNKMTALSSVPDPNPDPDPLDPHVFGPPGSGSFYQQAKNVRKTLISTVL